MENQAEKMHFIECPRCQGRGVSERGGVCSECAGMGMGFFYRNKFLYWGLRLDRASLRAMRIKNVLDKIIFYLTFVFGIAGLVALGFWFWFQYNSLPGVLELSDFFFWDKKHYLILIFWLSLLADFFVIYHLAEDEVHRRKIPKNIFKAKSTDVSSLPDNWRQLQKKFHKVNVALGFGDKILKLIGKAYLLADKADARELDAKFLFLEILEDKTVRALFSRLGIATPDLFRKVEALARRQIEKKNYAFGQVPRPTKLLFSNSLKEILISSYLDAYLWNQSRVDALNVLLFLAEKDDDLKEILFDFKADLDKIKNVIHWFKTNETMVTAYERYRKQARFKPAKAMNRAYTSVATPVLNVFSRDLTYYAKWGRLEFCVAREKEIEEIFQSWESGRAGIILVGEAGVGKRAVVNGIAQKMVEEDVPAFLEDKRLLELDISKLLAGVTAAEAEQRLLMIDKEIRRAGNIILFIDNVENITGITAGEEASLDLSEVLAGALEKGDFYCLASASTENYTKHIKKKQLGAVLARIIIKEPLGNQGIQIVQSKIGSLEHKYKIWFSYDAIEASVNLSGHYLHEEFLPEKAIKILETTGVKTGKRCLANKSGCLVTGEDVAATVSAMTGIPLNEVGGDEGQKLLNLENRIHARMIGQEEAVKMVADSLRRARAAIREEKKPIASFLFLGPTGVGKTELAKTIADVYFGNEKNMVRLDMSEYQNQDSVGKILGNNAGALGYLTEAVRNKPFSLVLLDEFEKAHPDILNLFLQVMDEGRLTDGQGRTIDFTNTIIIATSNAGAFYIREQIRQGVDVSVIKENLIREHLNKVMRPELINRFDGLIVFKPLSESEVESIAVLILHQIGQRLTEKGINLELDPAGVAILARQGYDPEFGARPLKRLLQDKVENEIANRILNNEATRRDTILLNSLGQVEVIKARAL